MPNSDAKRPNILIIASHDTGQFISPYGVDTVATPNFERLAAESTRFSRAFCTAPQCSPARAALFSGCYPHQVGVLGNSGPDKGWRFRDDCRHAARILGEQGYQTWGLGLIHETWLHKTLGFDHVELGFGICHASDKLSALLDSRDDSRPFYCQIGCWETHRAWDREDTQPSDALGVTVPPYLEAGPETTADMAQMQGCVERLDRGIGQIMDLLEARGLVDDTILVVTTDHGLAITRAKGTLLDSGVEVFLFMRWPGGEWGRGVVQDALISHVDVLPTLLDAIGLAPEAQMAGQSQLPLLDAGCDRDGWQPRDRVYAQKTWFHFYDPQRLVRGADYALVQQFEFCRQSEMIMDAIASGSTAENWLSFAGGHTTPCELYDLRTDPDEMTNIAADEPERVKALQAELLAWMEAHDDPLLDGPVASPYYDQVLDALRAAARQDAGQG